MPLLAIEPTDAQKSPPSAPLRILARLALVTRLDWLLFGLTLLLAAIGVAVIYSAGYRGPELPSSTLWQKQIVWLGLGLAVYFTAALTDYRWLCRWSWVFYAGAIGGLIVTLVYGFVTYGARSWVRVGGLAFQPSEPAKLAIALALAGWIGHKAREPRHWHNVAIGLALVGVPFVLILKQPDLGSAMVLVPMTLCMLFVARAQSRYLLGILLVGLIAAPTAYPFLKDRQKERIIVFWKNLRGQSDTRGWHLAQSKIAVGSGGLTGKGWRQGAQSRLGYLPVAQKDFVFSVYAEEHGFVGSALLLGAYGLLLGLGLKIAAEASDRMGAVLAAGLVVMLFTHVLINIGMTIGLLPITGLPLPLISYGGSFALTTMAALGLLQSVRLHRRLF